jgi:signal transduction histidine kinase
VGQSDHSRGVLAITEETVEYGLFEENSPSIWAFVLANGVDISRAAVLHALLNDALGAQEAERRRIARELRADTAQSLVSLLVGLRTVEESHDLGQVAVAAIEVRGLASAALENVQRLAFGLEGDQRHR